MKAKALFLAILVSYPSILLADSYCRAVVSYKWKTSSDSDAVSVEVGEVKGKGPDEGAARSELENNKPRELQEALKKCKDTHENLSGCMANKFITLSSSTQKLSFSAKKQLEDAIIKDCKNVQGICESAIAGDVKCFDVKKANQVEAQVTPESEGAAKDDNKKEAAKEKKK